MESKVNITADKRQVALSSHGDGFSFGLTFEVNREMVEMTVSSVTQHNVFNVLSEMSRDDFAKLIEAMSYAHVSQTYVPAGSYTKREDDNE